MENNNQLIDTLSKIRKRSIVPDSGFSVACVIKDESGDFYTGANIEFIDRTLGICAEGAAISKMLSEHGPRQIKKVYLMGGSNGSEDTEDLLVPCGICLQRLSELACPEAIVEVLDPKIHKKTKFYLKELLPHANTLRDYFPQHTNYQNQITFDNIPRALQLLLEWNYSPDSKKKEAVILKTEKNHFFCGVYFSTCCYKADIHALNMAVYNFLLSDFKHERITNLFYTSNDPYFHIHPEFSILLHGAIIKGDK